jgi:hypothetical protein
MTISRHWMPIVMAILSIGITSSVYSAESGGNKKKQ